VLRRDLSLAELAAEAELDRPALYDWVSKRCSGWK